MTPPQTPADWSAHRARINCQVGKDVLRGETPPPRGVARQDYALYLLFCVLDELVSTIDDPRRQTP